MKYNIFEGFDWINQRPIFQVKGVDNDYCGEWHTTKPEAQKELDGLIRDCMKRDFIEWSIQASLDCEEMERKQMTTAQLRKTLKELGYKLSITSSSLGRHASITHIESGFVHGNVEMDGIDQVRQRWGKFGDFVTQNRDAIIEWAKNEGVFGHKSWFDTIGSDSIIVDEQQVNHFLKCLF